MSKGKLAGIIIACVVVVVVVVIAANPGSMREPVEFDTQNLRITPQQVEPGQTVSVSVEVQNAGETRATQELVLKLNGVMVHSEDVAADGGETVSVSFSFEIHEADTAGLYTVELGGLTGTFSVVEPPSEPTAAFRITHWGQSYLELYQEWSESVHIYYTIENTGDVHISRYRVHFKVTYADNSESEVSGLGSQDRGHIRVGQTWRDDTVHRVEGPGWTKGGGKEVVSVELSHWELTAGQPPEVMYEITGTAQTVDVTLSNATGGTEQYSIVRLPKKYIYTSFVDRFAYISAQNRGTSGTVTVSIYLNGELFKTSSSSGAYVIATASGTR